MTAPQFDLPAIRERNPLSAAIGQRVALKRAGREYKAACPFHAEKTPSFTVNDDKGFYHCFGCGAHGDVVGFVMQYDALSFVEACRMLTQAGGLDDPRILQQARERAARHQAELAQRDAFDREQQRQRSRRIWGETERITVQSPALLYFERRGIAIPRLPDARLPADIHYHPALEYWWTPSGDTQDQPANSRADAGASQAKGADATARRLSDRKPIAIATCPALVTAIRNNDDAGVGVEIRYLNFDGTKAEPMDPETGEILTHKKQRGNPWGGSIHLTPRGRRMRFAEGQDTALSVLVADPSLPVWACLSIGNLAGASLGRGRRIALIPTAGASHKALARSTGEGGERSEPGEGASRPRLYRFLPSPVPDLEKPAFLPPPECHAAELLEDADNADPQAADAQYRCATARWKAAGLSATRVRPPEGKDFNDVLREKAA